MTLKPLWEDPYRKDFVREPTVKQRTRNQLRAEALMKRLEDNANTKETDPDYRDKHLEPGQIQSIQIILKKLVPDLSAVEQTITDDRDNMTEEQIFQKMKMLIEASPDIASKLRALLIPTLVQVEKKDGTKDE